MISTVWWSTHAEQSCWSPRSRIKNNTFQILIDLKQCLLYWDTGFQTVSIYKCETHTHVHLYCIMYKYTYIYIHRYKQISIVSSGWKMATTRHITMESMDSNEQRYTPLECKVAQLNNRTLSSYIMWNLYLYMWSFSILRIAMSDNQKANHNEITVIVVKRH